ncbi:MAG: flagellar hook-length control protein FliK [Terricaulis sp.]
MDFASEPVLDAFTPPPTRAAPRAPVADDNGQTFGDHLDAVNEPAPERAERPAPAQQNEAKDEAPRVEAKTSTGEDTSDHDETIDPEVALLGGPLPPTPPPMAAPVAVQIVASQPPEQAQAQPDDGDFNVAPVNAPQAPPPAEPAEEAAAAQPADQSAPTAGKTDEGADVPTQQQQQQAQQSAPQAQTAQTQVAVPQIPMMQTAPTTAEVSPEVLQQAIAATTAPAPQAAAQPATTPRASKDAKQPVEAKAASVDGEAKSDAHANVKAPVAKASNEGALKVDATPTLQTQSSAPDTSQLAQTNTIAATTSQASTHVQHAAADASRAAPVAAQVGREIVRRFSGGNTNFELRLDPADLGRVEVRMEVTRDNRVTAVITADNPQALTELARHARDLEQQLQSAGLQLSDNGLSFDLRQGTQGGESDDQRNSGGRGETNAAAPPQEQQAAPLARPIGIDRWRGVRVDVMV